MLLPLREKHDLLCRHMSQQFSYSLDAILVEDGDKPFVVDDAIVVAHGEGELFSARKGVECYHVGFPNVEKVVLWQLASV